MSDDAAIELGASALVRFPNREIREAFVRQIELWNAVEELPRVEVSLVHDDERVVVRSVASAERGIIRLIEGLGGQVLRESSGPLHLAEEPGEHGETRL